MPVIYGRTRLQLRQHIAPNVGAYVSSASAQGTTTTLIDNTLSQGAASDNAQRGRWLDFTSGTNSGLISQVTSSTVASNITTYTFAPARTQTESADTYIRWPQWLPPTNINRLLDEAVMSVQGRFYDLEESLAFCGDGKTARFDIPSEFTMLTGVFYRYYVRDITVHDCGVVFDESVDADFTVTVDSEDYKASSSLKFVAAGTISAGDIASDSISSLNLSSYTHIELWIKVVTAVVANDLRLRLSATVNGGTETESLNIPALTANTWTKVRLALANPRSDTAIISVALEYNANPAANTIWLDSIRAVEDDTSLWTEIPQQAWSIDSEAADLILSRAAVDVISDRHIKLVGGDEPALFTADSTATEVPERYMIAFVTLRALMSSRDELLRKEIPYWFGELERARDMLRQPIGMREV